MLAIHAIQWLRGSWGDTQEFPNHMFVGGLLPRMLEYAGIGWFYWFLSSPSKLQISKHRVLRRKHVFCHSYVFVSFWVPRYLYIYIEKYIYTVQKIVIGCLFHVPKAKQNGKYVRYECGWTRCNMDLGNKPGSYSGVSTRWWLGILEQKGPRLHMNWSEEFWTTRTRTSTNYGLKRRHVVHPSGSKWSLIGLNAPFPKTWKCAIEQINNKGFLGPGWSLPLVHYMMAFVGLVPRQGTPEWVPREQSLCDLLFLGSVRGAKKPWPWGTLKQVGMFRLSVKRKLQLEINGTKVTTWSWHGTWAWKRRDGDIVPTWWRQGNYPEHRILIPINSLLSRLIWVWNQFFEIDLIDSGINLKGYKFEGKINLKTNPFPAQNQKLQTSTHLFASCISSQISLGLCQEASFFKWHCLLQFLSVQSFALIPFQCFWK